MRKNQRLSYTYDAECVESEIDLSNKKFPTHSDMKSYIKGEMKYLQIQKLIELVEYHSVNQFISQPFNLSGSGRKELPVEFKYDENEELISINRWFADQRNETKIKYAQDHLKLPSSNSKDDKIYACTQKKQRHKKHQNEYEEYFHYDEQRINEWNDILIILLKEMGYEFEYLNKEKWMIVFNKTKQTYSENEDSLADVIDPKMEYNNFLFIENIKENALFEFINMSSTKSIKRFNKSTNNENSSTTEKGTDVTSQNKTNEIKYCTSFSEICKEPQLTIDILKYNQINSLVKLMKEIRGKYSLELIEDHSKKEKLDMPRYISVEENVFNDNEDENGETNEFAINCRLNSQQCLKKFDISNKIKNERKGIYFIGNMNKDNSFYHNLIENNNENNILKQNSEMKQTISKQKESKEKKIMKMKERIEENDDNEDDDENETRLYNFRRVNNRNRETMKQLEEIEEEFNYDENYLNDFDSDDDDYMSEE